MPKPQTPSRGLLPPGKPCPPSRRAQVPPMRYPGPGGTEDYVALGQQVYGLYSHFVYGQSYACAADEGNCEGCDHGQVPRWYGYLPALWLPSKRRVLVSITEGAYRECPKFNELDGSLRGVVFRLKRMNASKHAPVKLTITSPHYPNPLGPTFDVVHCLSVLWRLEEQQRVITRRQPLDTAFVPEAAAKDLILPSAPYDADHPTPPGR